MKEKILYEIIYREKQRTTARKIRYLRRKINTGSTTMVTIQLDDGSLKDLTGRDEIEEAIMANNQAKYQQSFHKPFLQSPFMEEFGFKGLTTASQAVLGGVYKTESHIDLCMKAFIKELIMPQEIRDLGSHSFQLSLASYQAFWKKTNERISCYPRALSFATMKGGSMDDFIAELVCNLINLALSSGYSLDRWKQLLDVMILKKSGHTQLSSLRTI